MEQGKNDMKTGLIGAIIAGLMVLGMPSTTVCGLGGNTHCEDFRDDGKRQTIGYSSQENLVKIVYSYARKQYDSLEIIINVNEKTVYNKNHRLYDTEVDSVNVGYAKKTDKVDVVLRGYKKDLYCFPYIDSLKYPYYRMSYGLNFECVRLKT